MNNIPPKKYNIITPGQQKSIWDPNSEFMQELELYKLRSEIKPRQVNMMQSQMAMIRDFCGEETAKKLYVPNGGSYK